MLLESLSSSYLLKEIKFVITMRIDTPKIVFGRYLA